MNFLGKIGIDWKSFLIQTINFLVLFLILKKFFFKPFIKALKEEKEKEDKIKRADLKIKKKKELMAKKEQEILEKIRKKSREIIAESEKMGEKEKEKILQRAEKEVQNILKEARERTELELIQMKNKEKEEILKRTKDVLNKILSKTFYKDLQKKYIENAISDLKKLDFSKVEKANIQMVVVISAFPLNRKEKKLISDFLFNKIKNSVFQEKIDRNLIAGIKIVMDGFLIDHSLKREIEEQISQSYGQK